MCNSYFAQYVILLYNLFVLFTKDYNFYQSVGRSSEGREPQKNKLVTEQDTLARQWAKVEAILETSNSPASPSVAIQK